MSKKVCIVSDIHFGVNRNSEMFLNSSIMYFRDDLAPYLRKHQIGTILVLGDVFDNRNSINVRISDEIYNLFSVILAEFNVHILIGNHDIYYKNSNDIHSLKFLNHLPNVDVIDELCYKEILGERVMFCPWIFDYNDDEVLDTLRSCNTDIMFGHFDIVGFALNNTRVSTEGLDTSVFDSCKKVFSGHYHKPSSKIIGKTEIVYIGSPYQMTRNDKDDTKGCIILDLETLQFNRVPNNTSIKFVDAEYPEIPTREYVEGNIVDAIITLDKKDIIGNIIDKYVDRIEELCPIEKVNVVLTVNSDNVHEFDEKSHGKMTSIPDLIELYINNDDGIIDKETILTTIMDIHEEVI